MLKFAQHIFSLKNRFSNGHILSEHLLKMTNVDFSLFSFLHCTPCYKKSILGSKQPVSGNLFFCRFSLRLSENNRSRVKFIAKLAIIFLEYNDLYLSKHLTEILGSRAAAAR